MKKFLLLITTTILLIATGCKSSKTTTQGNEDNINFVSETILQETAKAYSTWNTVSTSGRISISGAASFSTPMQLKMVRNKCIYISIRPILGIEAAKVFINSDSAVVVNKLNKVYTSIELHDLAHILPIDINALQDILLAKVFSLNYGTLSSDNLNKFTISEDILNNGFLIAPRNKNNKISYEFLLNKNKQVTALNVYPSASAKQYSAVYSNHATTSAGSEAENINISTTIRDKELSLELYLNSSKTKWDIPVEEAISLNKSYRKVSIMEFLSILKTL